MKQKREDTNQETKAPRKIQKKCTRGAGWTSKQTLAPTYEAHVKVHIEKGCETT